MSFPVIKAIRSFADVKSALDEIRRYFIGSSNKVGNVTIVQPSNESSIEIMDGVRLTAKANWELNKAHTVQTAVALDTTTFVEVKINGVTLKLGVVK